MRRALAVAIKNWPRPLVIVTLAMPRQIEPTIDVATKDARLDCHRWTFTRHPVGDHDRGDRIFDLIRELRDAACFGRAPRRKAARATHSTRRLAQGHRRFDRPVAYA